MFSSPFASSTKKASKSSMNPRRPHPRLDRLNAARNIDYDATASSPENLRPTRSLDLSPVEFQEDYSVRRKGGIQAAPAIAAVFEDSTAKIRENETARKIGGGDGGIKGVRPPMLTPPSIVTHFQSAPPTVSTLKMDSSSSSVLAPPPGVLLPAQVEVVWIWDLVSSFAANVMVEETRTRSDSSEYEEDGDDDDDDKEEHEEEGVRERLGETSEDVTSTSMMNHDDSSSSTTEGTPVISPNERCKRIINGWKKGHPIGSGSFGTVYKALSYDGIFFAVKEVSLLDQGNNAQQYILQLEEEIALLSQFEHENIVHYYGTEKGEAKLFIFLELVTQGSLASLYRKYRLQDSQVSAYTRQILKGLVYLHEQNVVHRDIKCANILVHANGSVKLADFGLVKQITKNNVLKSRKESAYWMAPEVIKAKSKSPCGPAADIWSLGCTVLEMLTQKIPYPDMELQHVLYKVGKGEKPPIPNNLSSVSRDFINQCVQAKPADRPSASQLLEHPFVKRSLHF